MAEPEELISHFKIWDVAPEQMGEVSTKVFLTDQFDEDHKRQAKAKKLVWLGNPVEKNNKKKQKKSERPGETDKKYVHLTGWEMKFDRGDDNPPAGTWEVSNQLNDYKFETWKIGKPAILLLPAAKAEPDGKLPDSYPKEKDHYLCYLVEGGKTIDVDIALNDQIDDKFEKEKKGKATEDTTKLTPKYLGVPVKKEGLGEPGKRINKDAHLAIYELDKKERRKFGVQYQVLDQFVPAKGSTVTVNESHYLAVPSKKREQR
jgi:hypothetical protein